MTFVVFDRVQDTTTTTGTGAFALDDTPPAGCRSFDDVCSSDDTVPYSVQHRTADEWEDGIGTFTSPSTLARTEIKSSSNAGAAVNFTAGTKDIALTIQSWMVDPIDGGTF